MDDLLELKELALHYVRGIWENRWIALFIAWAVLLVGVAGGVGVGSGEQAATTRMSVARRTRIN